MGQAATPERRGAGRNRFATSASREVLGTWSKNRHGNPIRVSNTDLTPQEQKACATPVCVEGARVEVASGKHKGASGVVVNIRTQNDGVWYRIELEAQAEG